MKSAVSGSKGSSPKKGGGAVGSGKAPSKGFHMSGKKD